MTRQDILEGDKFSNKQAQYMLDCEQLCNFQYRYNTTHVDAADSYEVLFGEGSEFGLNSADIDRIEFTTESDVELSVYLGQSEMEIQLPRQLTFEEARYFSRNTDYVVKGPSDLAYISYPMNLSVKAVLY